MTVVDGVSLDVPGPVPPFTPEQIRHVRLVCAAACLPGPDGPEEPSGRLAELLDMLGLPRDRDLVPYAISRIGHAEVWNVVETGHGRDRPVLVDQSDSETGAWKIRTRHSTGIRAVTPMDVPRADVHVVHVVARVLDGRTENRP